jgi:hypothetical protein
MSGPVRCVLKLRSMFNDALPFDLPHRKASAGQVFSVVQGTRAASADMPMGHTGECERVSVK